MLGDDVGGVDGVAVGGVGDVVVDDVGGIGICFATLAKQF